MSNATYVTSEAGKFSSRHALSVDSFDGDSQPGYAKGPERNLMLAILFDGLESYISFMCAKSRSAKLKYQEAYNWVNSANQDYIFSFEGVCEGLGIDPNFLRRGLGGVCQIQLVERKRSRRHF